MDCGNKAVTVETNSECSVFYRRRGSISAVNVRIDNSTIIPPCYIGEDVYLINSTVGPNVSLGKDAMLRVVQLKV
jgi:glucose-1-phosphate thymidylyltransferase